MHILLTISSTAPAQENGARRGQNDDMNIIMCRARETFMMISNEFRLLDVDIFTEQCMNRNMPSNYVYKYNKGKEEGQCNVAGVNYPEIQSNSYCIQT